MSRGGATNAPASVYAIRKWDEWLRKYAPPGAASYDFYQSLPALSQGNAAQQIFWDTAFTASMVAPQSEGNNTVDAAGKPLWRMAPSPKGPYWEEGQKLGYQDAGSWTLFKSTPVDRRKAAWLYAQFTVSKSVSLKKTHVGLTLIRDSDIRHASFTESAPNLGGLVEFHRSPDRVCWSPTGINVPDYPKLAQIWWQQIGDVNSGVFTAQQAMDRLASEMDQVMARMQSADERANVYGGCGPRLNEEKDPSAWLSDKESPKKKRNEKPPGQTIAYDELIKRWQSN
jgi:glycerol transport system substrate-binding protein